MRTNRSLWVFLSLFFFSLGAYLLFDSIYHPGQFAEAGVLFGGTLIAFSLFTCFVAIDEQLHVRALERHMRRHSRARRDSRAA